MKRTLLASLLLHAAAIAVLLSVRFPEPSRTRFARATPIASPYRPAAPVAPKPRSIEKPLKTARTFVVPDLTPEPLPLKLILIVPDPPSIRPSDIPAPAPAPAPRVITLDLPLARVVKAAGFSSIESNAREPVHRTLAATGGFDTGNASRQAVTRGEITPGAFGDASLSTAAPRARTTVAPANLSAAEILSKPRPAYTDEARRLQIEGEVLLEVLFGASGEASVLRTIRGLGHGLDENAIAAARAVRFRPAQREGTSVDSTAVVHIVFRLAY